MNVYDEIMTERVVQDRKWGGPPHDDEHASVDWLRYIAEHCAEALGGAAEIVDEGHWLTATISGSVGGMPAFRRQMVRVAALAVAAIESYDRRQTSAGVNSALAARAAREGAELRAAAASGDPTNAAAVNELRSRLLQTLGELSGAEATIEDPFPGTTEVR